MVSVLDSVCFLTDFISKKKEKKPCKVSVVVLEWHVQSPFPLLIITALLFEFPENSRSSNDTSSIEFQSFAWSWALFEQLTNQNSEWSAYVHFLWQDYVSLISSNSLIAEQTAAYATWWQASAHTRTAQDRAAPINTCHIQNRNIIPNAKKKKRD